MATVNQEFQSAPMGRRVVVATVLSFSAIAIVFAVNFALAARGFSTRASSAPMVAATLAPALALLVAVPSFLCERAKIGRFRIEENCLVLGKKRFPLEGLVAVERDPDVLRRAFKIWGNGGIGSIRGRFRSRKLGSFYAFLTCTENAVVLRWPDKAAAVSPVDPDFFILTARSAAAIR